MSTMKLIKPSSVSEKQTRTTMDTIELTPKLVASWKSPPFQRDLKFNAKVLAVGAAILRAGGVLPGVVTVGILDGDTYIVDGQHRLAAWLHTALPVGYADVRTHWFETMGAMANEFVELNSPLVRLKPDDILRGLEPSTVALQRISKNCGFIGFDKTRRGSETKPVLSMSVFIRTWVGTKPDVPQGGGSGLTALAAMDEAETTAAIEFAGLCFEAWRRDVEYGRLWGTLNLTLCAWLYRRIVLGERASSASRVPRFTKEQFRKCLMALSAEPQYLDYLVGRNVSERDRGPAYTRVKTIFQRRYLADTGQSLRLPAPAWAHE